MRDFKIICLHCQNLFCGGSLSSSKILFGFNEKPVRWANVIFCLLEYWMQKDILKCVNMFLVIKTTLVCFLFLLRVLELSLLLGKLLLSLLLQSSEENPCTRREKEWNGIESDLVFPLVIRLLFLYQGYVALCCFVLNRKLYTLNSSGISSN